MRRTSLSGTARPRTCGLLTAGWPAHAENAVKEAASNAGRHIERGRQGRRGERRPDHREGEDAPLTTADAGDQHQRRHVRRSRHAVAPTDTVLSGQGRSRRPRGKGRS
jgi:hypothetical protein